jgi:hypothetical protein
MLGNKIGEFHGKIVSERMLPPEGGNPKFETTVEVSGKILGVHARIISTYWSVLAADGTLYGESPLQSLTVTEHGDRGLFRASGSGWSGPGLDVKFRGALFYIGAHGKLAPLNGHTLVFEWDQDDDGVHFSFWEWK